VAPVRCAPSADFRFALARAPSKAVAIVTSAGQKTTKRHHPLQEATALSRFSMASPGPVDPSTTTTSPRDHDEDVCPPGRDPGHGPGDPGLDGWASANGPACGPTCPCPSCPSCWTCPCPCCSCASSWMRMSLPRWLLGARRPRKEGKGARREIPTRDATPEGANVSLPVLFAGPASKGRPGERWKLDSPVPA
jgi:hypothetical protein